ncbi:UL7 [Gallid alphaherpesvirus 2]|uniref:UL7 n=1 Tax=Gallid alphaherpesvirus 2 TaxID=10390 RepID=H6WUT7_9ALPH|nr:UL7 [Gallid alphaherpesvirus 2]UOW65309.1 UL7 [Gallid alphaherpesvirus 2]
MEEEMTSILHPLDVSDTLDALVINAIDGTGNRDAIIEELSRQPMARMMMEVREINGVPTQFTGVSVYKLRVANCIRRLHLILAGTETDEEISSDIYYTQCIANPAFKGFIFMILTAMEDVVKTIGMPPPLLKYRFVSYHPAEPLDFALCLLISYLENRNVSSSDPSLYVQLQSFLKYAWSTVTPMRKMRRFLCITNTWLLNTLMELSSISPFDSNHVLPHYIIYKHLSSTNGVCDVLISLYECNNLGEAFQVPVSTRGKCSIVINKGLLNGAFQQKWLSDIICDWWHYGRNNLRGEECLFHTYQK